MLADREACTAAAPRHRRIVPSALHAASLAVACGAASGKVKPMPPWPDLRHANVFVPCDAGVRLGRCSIASHRDRNQYPRRPPAAPRRRVDNRCLRSGGRCIVLVLGVGRSAFRPPRVVFVLGIVSLINSLTHLSAAKQSPDHAVNVCCLSPICCCYRPNPCVHSGALGDRRPRLKPLRHLCIR